MSERDVYSAGAGEGGAGSPGGGAPEENGVLAGSADGAGVDGGGGGGVRLSAADAAALDALVEAGWEVGRVGAGQRERAGRVAAVLGLTDVRGGVHRDEALEDVVLLRVARLRASGAQRGGVEDGAALIGERGRRGQDLCEDDARALDALVEAGMDPAGVEPSAGRRAGRQLGLLSLLDVSPGSDEERERRIERMLLAVQRSIDEQGSRMALDAPGAARSRIQFADLVSVAALLLIGSAVLLPIMDGMRAYGRRAACQTAMHAAGVGFGQYALASRDVLPMASPSRAGTPWWDVGGRPEQSNSANLFTLVRTGYTSVGDLACAGNREACRSEDGVGEMDWRRFPDVSYSYRMMFGRGSAALTDGPATVLIADRSPMVMVRPGVLFLSVFSNSPNHGGRGQFVLLGDGSVRWMTSPVFRDGDNLWLPRSIEDAIRHLEGGVVEDRRPLRGTETPGGVEDNFVAP